MEKGVLLSSVVEAFSVDGIFCKSSVLLARQDR